MTQIEVKAKAFDTVVAAKNLTELEDIRGQKFMILDGIIIKKIEEVSNVEGVPAEPEP